MAVLSAKVILSSQNKGDSHLFKSTYNFVKLLLDKQMPKQKIRKVMIFLRSYISFENPEIKVKFDQELTVLTERRGNMGIEEFVLEKVKKEGVDEGIEKGVDKGIKMTAVKMKKSGFDVKQIADLTGLSVEEIERLS